MAKPRRLSACRGDAFQIDWAKVLWAPGTLGTANRRCYQSHQTVGDLSLLNELRQIRITTTRSTTT